MNEAGSSSGAAESEALLRKLFPFFFSIGSEGRLVSVGDRWRTFAPQVEVGASFESAFEISRPVGLAGRNDIGKHLDGVFLLELVERTGFELRGQFLTEANVLHFVGGPWVTNLSAMTALGLELRDFPPHDPRGDLLIMLQTQESSLADLRQLTANLREKMEQQSQLESQIQQIQKMELVGRFAGGLAHNFNNILMAIQGYAELSLANVAEQDPVHEWIQEICAATNHAASLTRGLLTMSRRHPVKPEALDLAKEFKAIERLVAPLLGEAVQLEMHIDPALGTVYADSSSLKQILMNLLLNARDAMPEGGKVALAVAPTHVANGQQDFIEISVADTGVGMDEQTKANIFEPFFTTKAVGKGLGLGLSTVYGLVHQTGGWLTVESEVGKGSTFRILIPHVEAPVQQAVEPQPPEAVHGQRILLVDDEQPVRNLLQRVLVRAGFEVIAAADATEALAVLEGGRCCDLLLTDVVMPGMTGLQLSRQVEAQFGLVPTIFMSGHNDDDGLDVGNLPAHQQFLQKPFAPSTLMQSIRWLLAK